MPAPTTPTTYTTVEEAVALYTLPRPRAELLLEKTNAVLDHGKTEPDGVADAEDRKLWVEEGYTKLAILDKLITRLRDHGVERGDGVADVERAIEKMEEEVNREEQEAEERRRVEEEQRLVAEEVERLKIEEEERRITEKEEQRRRVEEERRRVEEEEGRRVEDEKRNLPEDVEKAADPETQEEEAERRDQVEVEKQVGAEEQPNRVEKRPARFEIVVPTRRTKIAPSVTSHHSDAGSEDVTIVPPQQLVCEYCRTSPSTIRPGPCGGPKKFTTKVSCERCHQSKKRCSFNPVPPRRKRKAAEADDNDDGEGSSRASIPLGSRLGDDSDDDDGLRKRIRRGKRRADENENETDGGEEALTERLRLAYEGVMHAEVELMKARVALNEYVSRVDKKWGV